MDFSTGAEKRQAVPPSRLWKRQAEDIWLHCRGERAEKTQVSRTSKERKKQKEEEEKEGGWEERREGGPNAAVSSCLKFQL